MEWPVEESKAQKAKELFAKYFNEGFDNLFKVSSLDWCTQSMKRCLLGEAVEQRPQIPLNYCFLRRGLTNLNRSRIVKRIAINTRTS